MTDQGRIARGEHLRRVRRQRGMSLADVEQRSGGRITASALGSYERGDRAISTDRLAELADHYGVDPRAMLPGAPSAATGTDGLGVDVAALEAADGRSVEAVRRFVRSLAHARQEAQGRVVAVRAGDVRVIAASLGMEASELMEELSRAEVLA